MLQRLTARTEPWVIVVIGGGATGAGVALDAARRGYSTLLLERGDFGCGTSSRSTKLIHGGVRYLRQGNFSLVFGALRERGLLKQNAPHLVHDLGFVIPCYRRRDVAMFAAGLTAYDLLAGRHRFGRSRVLSANTVKQLLPSVCPEGLRGGVLYRDAQFDDSRLLLHILMTAVEYGGTVLNYASAIGLTRNSQGVINGVQVRDAESGNEFHASAHVVVNAAGPFCDEVRQLARASLSPIIAASQGSHVVLPRSFLPADKALLIPETPDGRVLFAIPWHGHTLVGTTDVALPTVPREPVPNAAEIAFILETAGRYLTRVPRIEDVLSTFAGIRPLVKASSSNTASLARDHTIRMDAPGLLTITGGKWTTYREMAEQCVDRVERLAKWKHRPSETAHLHLHGYCKNATGFGALASYGTDASAIRAIAENDASLAGPLHPDLPIIAAEVVWAVRAEMARTVEDVLARRTRALFLNAKAAREMAPQVAALMARELGHDAAWSSAQLQAFEAVSRGYCVRSA